MRLSYASKLKFINLEGEVQRVLLIDFSLISRRQLLPLSGISDSLPQVMSNLVQSDLESSSSQNLGGGKITSAILFSSCENGWYCKICSAFAPPIMTATPFVNKAGTFGDHPTRNANRHLQIQYHKDAVSDKLAFDNLSKQ